MVNPQRQETLTRHNICLYPGDYETLKREYPGKAALIVRALVRKFVRDRMGLEADDIEVEL